MTRKNAILLTVALVAVGAVISGVALAAFLYYSFVGFGARDVTGDERKLVLTTASFAEFGIEGLDPKAEKLVSKRAIDGAREIECEYEDDDVYFISGAEVHRRAREARESFALTIGAWKTGIAIGSDAKIEPAEALMTGVVHAGALPRKKDEVYAAYITSNGKRLGNLFLVRNGRVLHTLMITGYYFDEPEQVHALLEPLLAESKRRFGG